MCISVNLNHQPGLDRGEVDDVWPNRVLTPKLDPKLASSQVLPQSPLHARGLARMRWANAICGFFTTLRIS